MTDKEMAAQLVECLDRDVTALRTLYRDLNARYEAQAEDDAPEGEQAVFLLDQAGRLASRLASLG
jgi:uncharacterized protein involved in exopolysaccharide biosynthesis